MSKRARTEGPEGPGGAMGNNDEDPVGPSGEENPQSGLLYANNLIYTFPSDYSVCVNSTRKEMLFAQRTYNDGDTMICSLNTGADYIDPLRSYLSFDIDMKLSVTTGDAGLPPNTFDQVSFGKNGTAVNVIKEIFVQSRSGDDLYRIRNFNLLQHHAMKYSYSKSWWDTAGKNMSEPSYVTCSESNLVNHGRDSAYKTELAQDKGSLVNGWYAPRAEFQKATMKELSKELQEKGQQTWVSGRRRINIPMYCLGGIFSTDKLLPAMLVSGMTIRIELEHAKFATVWGKTRNIVTEPTDADVIRGYRMGIPPVMYDRVEKSGEFTGLDALKKTLKWETYKVFNFDESYFELNRTGVNVEDTLALYLPLDLPEAEADDGTEQKNVVDASNLIASHQLAPLIAEGLIGKRLYFKLKENGVAVDTVVSDIKVVDVDYVAAAAQGTTLWMPGFNSGKPLKAHIKVRFESINAGQYQNDLNINNTVAKNYLFGNIFNDTKTAQSITAQNGSPLLGVTTPGSASITDVDTFDYNGSTPGYITGDANTNLTYTFGIVQPNTYEMEYAGQLCDEFRLNVVEYTDDKKKGPDRLTDLKTVSNCNYQVTQPRFIVHTCQLTDAAQRALNTVSATNGLEIVFYDYETTTTPPDNSMDVHVEVKKAVSRAMKAFAVIRDEKLTSLATSETIACVTNTMACETFRAKSFYWQLGALYFPHQRVDGNSAAGTNYAINETAQSAYIEALDCFGRFAPKGEHGSVGPQTFRGMAGGMETAPAVPVPGRMLISQSAMGSVIPYASELQPNHDGSGILAVGLERSSIFELSGIPINNSRVLMLHATFGKLSNDDSDKKRVVDIFLKYVKIARVFVHSVEVEE